MASVGIFDGRHLYDAEGKFRIADIRRLINSRLALVPKLRQRACPGLLGQAPPVWLDYPDFAIEDHVRVCQLAPPATENELRRLCAQLMSVPLDRTRPLWDLTFVEGLDDSRVALIERLHHSMADGLAAAELATVLLDLSPESSPLEEPVHLGTHLPAHRPGRQRQRPLALGCVPGPSGQVVRGDDPAPHSAQLGSWPIWLERSARSSHLASWPPGHP